MTIICYDLFNRFSLSFLKLREIFKNVKQKNKDALINTNSQEIHDVITKFFPKYSQLYKNKCDGRYVSIVTTLLQEHSDLFLCPSFEDIGFLGDLENKIQFCFTDKINVIVNNNIVTVIPKYIFEIKISSLFNLNEIERNEIEEVVNVSYKIYKLNTTDHYHKIGSNTLQKNKLNFSYTNLLNEKVFNNTETEYTFESNIVEYDEIHNLSSEKEMYDKIGLIINEGCLPIKNNRVICDIFEDFYSIEDYKLQIYEFAFNNITKFLNNEYKKFLIDDYYNSRNSILPFILNKRTKPLSSTLSKIKEINIYNLAKKKLRDN